MLNMSILNATNISTMNSMIGMTFATVTMLLMNAACWTPRRIRKWNIQMPSDAKAIAIAVLPSPNIGKNAPSVDLISTQYDTLPIQLPIQ